MKSYLVGGAVRDKVMGHTPRDRDFVVLGTTSEEMIRLGYQKVGQSFSVFLHPETREQYALPRGLTLEEDLSRRDLTINAMAIDENGKLVDPFNGAQDLKDKVLRHVSEHFSEDPLRLYRVMRFKARWPEFIIAPETKELCRRLAQTPEFRNIKGDRVFIELKLALQSEAPSVFFNGLREIGALKPMFSELEKLIDVPQLEKYHPEGDAWNHTMLVVDKAALLTKDLLVRYSALIHDLGKGVTPPEQLPRHIGHEETGVLLVKQFGERLLVPNDWTEAAVTVTRFHLRVHRLSEMKASSIVRMFYEMDAFRKPYLIDVLESACQADEMGKLKDVTKTKSQLSAYFAMVKDISSKDVPKDLEGKALGEEIRDERVRKLRYLIEK